MSSMNAILLYIPTERCEEISLLTILIKYLSFLALLMTILTGVKLYLWDSHFSYPRIGGNDLYNDNYKLLITEIIEYTEIIKAPFV